MLPYLNLMDFWKYTFFGGFEFSVCCYVTLCMGSLCGCFEELKSCCCRVFFSFRSAIFFVFLWNFRLWFYCIWWWLAETKKLVCCIFRFYFLFFFISNCNIIYNSYLNAWFGYLVFFLHTFVFLFAGVLNETFILFLFCANKLCGFCLLVLRSSIIIHTDDGIFGSQMVTLIKKTQRFFFVLSLLWLKWV